MTAVPATPISEQRLSQVLQRNRQAGRKNLVTFITAGYPSLAQTEQLMHALVNAGVDVIELGVPFSDPMADGPVIQRASECAVAQGVGLRDVLALVAQFRRSNSHTPVVLMGYANPVERIGQEAFIADAERIADVQWDRANAAMDAQSAAEAKRKAADTEAAQIRETALRDAQKAADALLAAAQDQGVREALRVTEEVSKRLEAELLSEGQKALLNAERERDQWRTAFELLRDAVKSLIPANLYETVRDRFMGKWSKHPDNPERKPEPPPPSYSAGPSGP